MERLALQVLASLGIEVRLGAEVRATEQMRESLEGRFTSYIGNQLAYVMAQEITNKVTRSEVPEMTTYKNDVPEYMGVNIHRAESIVFHPEEFDRFLEEYTKAVILNNSHTVEGRE